MTMSEDLRAHTIPTDLPPNQTRSLIIRQLQKVQQVSQPVLQQLDQAISAETDRLDVVEARLQRIEEQIQFLPQFHNQALKASAPLRYPGNSATTPFESIFPQCTPDSELPIALEPESFADPGKDNKTKELYAFFKQALLEQPGPYQDTLVGVQQRLESVTNLVAFGAKSLSQRLGEAGAVTDSLAITTVAQRSLTHPENVHLATPSLINTARPILHGSGTAQNENGERSSSKKDGQVKDKGLNNSADQQGIDLDEESSIAGSDHSKLSILSTKDPDLLQSILARQQSLSRATSGDGLKDKG